jgi:large subunit ribosomal protein L13
VKAPSYKTISANKATVNKEWLVVDAEGHTLGRLASKVAKLIRGKYKPNFTPHVDCGDNVIVLNADKVVLSGLKEDTKVYLRHTGFPGGQRTTTVAQARAKKPTFMLENAVKGMLPKGPLGYAMIKKLKIYEGDNHPHTAQQPMTVEL